MSLTHYADPKFVIGKFEYRNLIKMLIIYRKQIYLSKPKFTCHLHIENPTKF